MKVPRAWADRIEEASMGPSSGDDGNPRGDELGHRLGLASMGPSSGDDGNRDAGSAALHVEELQWGRRLVTTEMGRCWVRTRVDSTRFNGAVVW